MLKIPHLFSPAALRPHPSLTVLVKVLEKSSCDVCYSDGADGFRLGLVSGLKRRLSDIIYVEIQVKTYNKERGCATVKES